MYIRRPCRSPTANSRSHDFLRRSVEERVSPTVAEIAAHFGMRSPNAAAQHLRPDATKRGDRDRGGVARGIRLNLHAGAAAKPTLARAAKSMPTIARELPIVGRVAAGSPILAEQNLEGSLAVDPAIFRPRADYLLRVVGDSMVGIGIHEGISWRCDARRRCATGRWRSAGWAGMRRGGHGEALRAARRDRLAPPREPQNEANSGRPARRGSSPSKGGGGGGAGGCRGGARAPPIVGIMDSR